MGSVLSSNCACFLRSLEFVASQNCDGLPTLFLSQLFSQWCRHQKWLRQRMITHTVELSHLWVVGLGIVLVVCCFQTMCVVSSSDCCRRPLWSRVASIFVLVCGRWMCLLFQEWWYCRRPSVVLVWILFHPSHFQPWNCSTLHKYCCSCTSSSVHTCPYGGIFFKWAFLSTRCAIRVTSDDPEIALNCLGYAPPPRSRCYLKPAQGSVWGDEFSEGAGGCCCGWRV